ncbi:MAG: S1C family serine protease, partial [Terriglobales bacterium]
MKLLRPAILAVILAAGFLYFTTHRSGTFRTTEWLSHPQHVEITEAAGGESLDSEEQNNIGVYHKNIDSVVNITSRVIAYDFFYGAYSQEGQGSGFVIDKEGHILTNFHVIENAREVFVTLHGREKAIRATVVGMDKAQDLAVVQIKAPDLHPMTLGDSSHLQVGQKV